MAFSANIRLSPKLLNFFFDFPEKKIEIARGPKYMGKFQFVEASRRDLNKNLKYRGFLIIEVRIGEVLLYF